MKKVLCIKSLDYYAHCFLKYCYTWKAWQKSGNESHSFKNVELYYRFFFKKSCFLSTFILRKHGKEVACIFKDESHNFKNVVLFQKSYFLFLFEKCVIQSYIVVSFCFSKQVCNSRIYCCIWGCPRKVLELQVTLFYLSFKLSAYERNDMQD